MKITRDGAFMALRQALTGRAQNIPEIERIARYWVENFTQADEEVVDQVVEAILSARRVTRRVGNREAIIGAILNTWRCGLPLDDILLSMAASDAAASEVTA